ncbi:Uncharacterised protein [Citrobacter youngae]|uniref:Glycine-rich domain-containing protein n=1 Tax=Citrobacter youngae TaxID=133448 RepID=A0A9Q7ZRW0_9ENTR|nr:hypothetical protein [Citrobacter youngae]SUX81048.1 Uncharacterised protein [Citrobacter youngae]
MSKIARYQGNVRAFASDAQGLERTVFGGTNQADDLTSQITASFLRGWGIVGASEHPSLEDFNAAMYAMSQFIAYQHQMGVPEWHSEQEYHIGSMCTYDGESYQSLQNANVGSQPPSAKWTPVLTSKNGLSNLGLSTSRFAVVTSSQTITIPDWVTEIYVTASAGGGGGGGGGGGDTTYYGAGGGGGGAGESIIKRKFTVPAGTSLSITIGAAGMGANSSVGTGNDGNAGGNTVIGNLITLTGGGGGKGGINTPTSGGTIGGGKGGTGYPNGASGSDGILTAGTAAGGVGSSTPFGGGGGNGRAVTIAATESNGVNAYGYGSGGGGGGGKYGNASMGGGNTAPGGSGGNGAPGVVIIEW